MSEVKFTEDEIKKIDNIQFEYTRIKDSFGGICLNKISLRNRIDELDKYEETLAKEYEDNVTKENSLMDELNKKYGDGSFNPETKVFTPSK
mgnify:CR=1 FL=1|tara:strand:+ start:539 stop:811 length:273 start_codon:yes stop_codon:yes gene_type:complete